MQCAGNLNDSYVAMQDIPVYFQGMWERMCGRTQSRILPIHIGVMQKRFETVRLLLDMGADPNKFGQYSSGHASTLSL